MSPQKGNHPRRPRKRKAIHPVKSYLNLEKESLDIHVNVLRISLSSTCHPQPWVPPASWLATRQKLVGYLRSRQWDRLVEWAESVSPQRYDSPSLYFDDAQIAALIRKYPYTSEELPGFDPDNAALKKFLHAEHRCKWVNRRRRAKRSRFDPYAEALRLARSYIIKAIGLTPDLPAIYDKCDFTSGASVGCHGNATNLQRKLLADRWSVTSSALVYATGALWANAQIRDMVLPGHVKCYDYDLFANIVRAKVAITNYNKIAYVPKTARTSRTIAVEPMLNGFVQKGVDEWMRTRLKKRWGIDLRNQFDNSYMSYLGSRDPLTYSTLDLSSASDSISIEVVKDLLPSDWFEFLDEIRSPSYQLPGDDKTSRYEKFTSMGNGFCFPLETLIFASLAYAANVLTHGKGKAFAVYGDDIIVQPSAALLLTELLQEMGFKVNTEKSFYFGPFRESCGADWYEGQDVRPVNLDSRFDDVRNVISLHNSFLRSERTERFSEAIRTYLRSLSSEPVYRPSREPGDTAFSVSLDVAMSSRLVTWNRAVQQWRTVEILSLPVEDKFVQTRVESLDRYHSAGDLLDNLRVWTQNTHIRQMHEEVGLLNALRSEDGRSEFTLRYRSSVKIRPVTRPWSWSYHGFDEHRYASSLDRELARLLRARCAPG